MPTSPGRGRWRRFAAAVLAAGLAAGCGGSDDRGEPSPTRTTPPGTVQNMDEGDRVVLTATVDRVLSAGSFLVRDADLGSGGRLLVIAELPDGVDEGDLVSLDGTAARFRYADFGAAGGLGEPALYRDFERTMVLVAHQVRPR